MIIIKVIHCCDICERRHMARIELDDHMDISTAFANSNIIYKPEGWRLEIDGDKIDNQQRLLCPTCNKEIMAADCERENINDRKADNDTTCMPFFT